MPWAVRSAAEVRGGTVWVGAGADPGDVAGGTADPVGGPDPDPAGAVVAAGGAVTAVPSGLVTGVPSGLVTAAPAGAVTGVPSGLVTGVPSGLVTAAPAGAVTGVPSGLVTGVPSGLVTAAPAGVVDGRAVGVGHDRRAARPRRARGAQRAIGQRAGWRGGSDRGLGDRRRGAVAPVAVVAAAPEQEGEQRHDERGDHDVDPRGGLEAVVVSIARFVRSGSRGWRGEVQARGPGGVPATAGGGVVLPGGGQGGGGMPGSPAAKLAGPVPFKGR